MIVRNRMDIQLYHGQKTNLFIQLINMKKNRENIFITMRLIELKDAKISMMLEQIVIIKINKKHFMANVALQKNKFGMEII